MRLYLDDNITDRTLAALLRKSGHTVVRPADVSLTGASDARHLEHAIREGLTVVTGDHKDYSELHALLMTAGGRHHGILLVRYDNDSGRDMKSKHVVSVVGKLERLGVPVANQIIVLNQWR